MERQEIRIMDTGAPEAGVVSGWAYNLLGRDVLALAKEMQGERADSFADPAIDADYRLWKENRAAWLQKRKGICHGRI